MADRFLRPSSGADDRISRGDAHILRDRMSAHEDRLDAASGGREPFRSDRQLVQIYNGGSMPSSPELYYFSHPVMATGAEAENGTPTLTVDTNTTIPVIVLGHAPSVGDYFTAYGASGRWLAEKGGSRGGGGSIPCSPCSIPTEDLTVSWMNLLDGDGMATMAYDAGTHSWSSGCADNGLFFSMSCNSGEIEFRANFFTSGVCPTGTINYCSNLRTPTLKLTITDYTCSPFSLTIDVTDSDCPTVYSFGNTQFVVTL